MVCTIAFLIIVTFVLSWNNVFLLELPELMNVFNKYFLIYWRVSVDGIFFYCTTITLAFMRFNGLLNLYRSYETDCRGKLLRSL